VENLTHNELSSRRCHISSGCNTRCTSRYWDLIVNI
jgi:hypothetical protein